jgi:hypothetical protein
MEHYAIGRGLGLLALMTSGQPALAAQAQGQGQTETFGFISSRDRCLATADAPSLDSIDRYTRLEFATTSPVPIGINYGSELRSPLSRFFAGKAVSRILSLNATYSRHKVEATTTVASFSHKSSRKGYEWSSEVSNQRLITPYFRIDHDGTVKTNWKLALNKTYDVSTLQDLMDVVKRATNLISPSAGLLTSLNAPRFKDSSQFVDQSISSFLRESVDEIAPDEFPLAACAGKNLITLTLTLPESANIVRNSPSTRTVGTWTVRLAPPIRSIFMPATNNETYAAVLATIGAGSVFDYQVSENLSLGQFLNGDTAISAVRDEFTKANKANTATAAKKLCSLIVGKLQAIGLNRFDTSVSVAAYADQFLSEDAHRNALIEPGNCAVMSI